MGLFNRMRKIGECAKGYTIYMYHVGLLLIPSAIRYCCVRSV
jgi:hypothetical protein